MFKRLAILALGVSAVLLTGCDKKTETSPPAPNAAAPTVPAAPSSATPALPTAPPVTTPAVPSVTAPSADKTPVVPATPSVTPPATPTAPSVPATSATPAASGDVNADAKATLSQFGKDMVAKDWKAAGDDLKKLNAEKDKLSPDLQDAVKKAQTELDAAKATSGLKIPGLGGDSSNK